jgi:hypothetical protein
MPGEVSRSNPGPGPDSPYVPSWCYDPPGPRMCDCGHHEGYHNDSGECLQRLRCSCKGLSCPPTPIAGVVAVDNNLQKGPRE